MSNMSSYSPFIISSQEASQLVRRQNQRPNDNRQCFMIQVTFQPVYGEGSVPYTCYKKLPRLINGIPLGAGKLSQSQAQGITWRYLEGSRDLVTFISSPISREDADETRRSLKDCLVLQAKAVFGDMTVKSNIILTQCLYLDSDFFINDIADTFAEGLHFKD